MIPRIIHQVWVGSEPPEHISAWLRRWPELHPTWEYRLWRDADLTWLENSQPFNNAQLYVPSYRIGQLRADIARYEILWRYGGLYADADTEPLRPVDDALAGLSELAVAEFGDGDPSDNVGNAFIACEPGALALRTVIDEIARTWPAWRRHRRNVPATITGPALLTRAWHAHGCHIAPSREWYPYTYTQVVTGEHPRDFSDAYAVHHWEHIRELRRIGVMR